MIVVPKKNNKVRICVDFTELKKRVRREVYPVAHIQLSLAKLGTGANLHRIQCQLGNLSNSPQRAGYVSGYILDPIREVCLRSTAYRSAYHSARKLTLKLFPKSSVAWRELSVTWMMFVFGEKM